jgi:hypothetical protein
MERHYQEMADRKRVEHIDYIARLIRQFHSDTGDYPLESKLSDGPIEVFITDREVPSRYYDASARAGIELYPVEELAAELERVLWKGIELPSDPQKVATFAPNFYIYHVDESQACVAGHLYAPREGARRVRDWYYKYEHCTRIEPPA